MKKLKSKGYRVTRCISSGRYVITPPNGFAMVFDTINQAVNHYFKPSW